MVPEVEVLDLAIGLASVLGIFVAASAWLIYPILPFLLMGAIYLTGRYILLGLGRVAVRAEQRAADAVRTGARLSARWILVHEPEPLSRCW